MRLLDAARWADKLPVYDAYTGLEVFKAQFIISKGGSGLSHDDRQLSASPDVVIPARRAVKIFNDYWVVGDANTDDFRGAAIRNNYHLERSKGLLQLLTPAQACLGQTGTAFHANREYKQNMPSPNTDSEYDIFWNIIHSPSEIIGVGSFLRDTDSRVYRVRADYRDQGGFQFAEAYQLAADAAQTIVFTSNGGAVDPVTNAVPTISVSTTALQTGLGTFYRFQTQAEGGMVPGDLTVFIAASAITPVVGARFTMNSLSYRVVAVDHEIDAYALRARLA